MKCSEFLNDNDLESKTTRGDYDLKKNPFLTEQTKTQTPIRLPCVEMEFALGIQCDDFFVRYMKGKFFLNKT